MPLPRLQPRIAGLPLVLAGPILRRVTSTDVTVFVALKAERKATLRVRETDAAGPQRAVGTRVTIALGVNLHVVAVTATGVLVPGKTYVYDLAFAPDDGGAGPVTATTETLLTPGVVHADATVARTRLVYAEPGAPDLPSFALPPLQPADLRVVHASCRKPHAGGDDALRAADEMVRSTVATPTRRPHLLMLTGDQIYADDVADVLCAVAADAAFALLGWDEQLPTKSGNRVASVFKPGQRGDLVTKDAQLTTGDGASHLLSFGEFCAMYLLAWGEAIWPDTLPLVEDFSDAGLFVNGGRLEQRRAVTTFWRALPAIRRAFANIPTLMAFDDHEITDDWNLRASWTKKVLDPTTGAPLGQRIVQNGLAAFAIFQAWGNTPEQFAASGAAGASGRTLLEALGTWQGDDTNAGEALSIRTAVGMPTAFDAEGVAAVAPGALRWHYSMTAPSFQLLVLDTRTQRASPQGADNPAALLGAPGALQQQLRDVPLPDADIPMIVAAATPIFGNPFMEWLIGVGEWLGWYEFFDAETWSLQPVARELLLSALVTRGVPGPDGVKRRRIVVLCGDVHYGFSVKASYSANRTPAGEADRAVAAIAQLTASPAKNEDGKTHFLHGQGFALFSETLPKESVVGFANLSGGSVTAGTSPTSGALVLTGRPAFIKLPSDAQPAANVDWRYDVEFLLAADSDANRGPAPAPVAAPPAGNRDAALTAYLTAAGRHADDYERRFGGGKEIVGHNCIGEVTFEWGETDEAKAVVHQLWWAIEEQPTTFPLSRWRVSLANGSTAGAGIRLLVADAAGNTTPLNNGWVYVREAAGAVTTLHTQADGRLMRRTGSARDAPWGYDQPWVATAGAAVAVAFTRGARPAPEAVLARPALATAFVAMTVPALDAQGRGQLSVRGIRIHITRPGELELWPLLWQAPDAPLPWLAGVAGIDPDGRTYEKAGMRQRDRAYNNPAEIAGALRVEIVDGNAAAAPPAGAAQRTRGLLVEAGVDAEVTAATVEVLDRNGAVVAARDAFAPGAARRDATPVTLAVPASGRRTLEAMVILDDGVAATLGHVQVLMVCQTPDGPRIEASSALLTGVQASLVDDPTPGTRGAPAREGAALVVVDFGGNERPDGTSTPASPALTPAALADATRVRRMVRRRTRVITQLFDPASPAGDPANPLIPSPAMPLLMAELHLAGADHDALRDLMRRRWHRRDVDPATVRPAALLQLDLDLDLELLLTWNGGDAAAATTPNYPMPAIHHAHVTRVPGAVRATLRFNEMGELCDGDGDSLTLVDGDAVPNATAAATLPPWVDAGRRRPTVRVAQRRPWGRAGAATVSCTVVEWLPLQQAIRGGDGRLLVTRLAIGREGATATDVHGGIVPAAAPAAAAPAPVGMPPAQLPRFRVGGTAPSPAELTTLVAALVARRLPGMRGRAEIDALSDECWRVTFVAIVEHESGAHSQYDNRRPQRRSYTRGVNQFFFTLEPSMPTFGPPHGYGLGQIDNYGNPPRGASPDAVWDFVANVETMLDIVFNEKAPAAFGLLDDHMPAPTDQRWRAAYQREVVRRYNGGSEMAFSAGQWRINPVGGIPANIQYPNQILATNVNYAAARPIAFAAADFGPGTGP
ncbi:hypothetical protein GCM10009558_035710 [Virgisporangium aurantiacum]